MKTQLLALAIVALTIVASVADEFESEIVTNCLTSPESWRSIDRTRKIHNSDRWNWAIYKHVDNGDLLTLACLDAPSFLQSAGTRDNALEFAPSGHPYWIHRNFGFEIGPVKMLESELSVADATRGLPKTTVPVLEYVNVNENEKGETLMINGYVFVLNQKTYYVQHTSSRPARSTTAREIAERIMQFKLTTRTSEREEHRTKR
jgi:hypothetical protein